MASNNGHFICDRCRRKSIPKYRVESDIIDMIVCGSCGIVAEKLVKLTGGEKNPRPSGDITVTPIIVMV